MGELVDALVRVLEFVVQGALAVLLLGFALAGFHALKDSVYEHVHEMTAFMLPNWKVLKHPNTVVSVVIGVLYIAGIVTNSVGYWVLDPAHQIVISAAVSSPPNGGAAPVTASTLVGVVLRRVVFDRSPAPTKEYPQYLSEEVAWRNSNLEAVKHALDPLLKQCRVIRGTAVIALGFFLFSLLKASVFVVCLILLWLPDPAHEGNSGAHQARSKETSHKTTPLKSVSNTLHRLGDAMYTHMVDPHHQGKARTLRRPTALKYAASNALYAAVALVVLWCALGGYATTEREYHILAHAGGLSAAAAKKSSEHGNQASEHDNQTAEPSHAGE